MKYKVIFSTETKQTVLIEPFENIFSDELSTRIISSLNAVLLKISENDESAYADLSSVIENIKSIRSTVYSKYNNISGTVEELKRMLDAEQIDYSGTIIDT